VLDVDVMSEDELLVGITDALTLAGWTWMHIIRSDGVTMGHSGWFDIVAAKDGRILLWELKGPNGQLSHEQLRWQLAATGREADCRVIRPQRLRPGARRDRARHRSAQGLGVVIRELAKAAIGGVALAIGLWAWMVLIIVLVPGPK
jgi:hypothetical protein